MGLDPTPTGLNSSSVPLKHHGLTENTSFSDKLSKAWMSLRRLNPLDLNRAKVRKKFALLILAKSPKYNARRITEKKKKILREKKNQFIQRKNHPSSEKLLRWHPSLIWQITTL